MKVHVEDNSIFKHLKITIETESLEEIYGLLATFNTPATTRCRSMPGLLSTLLQSSDIEDAIYAVEAPLWNAVAPISKKLIEYLKVNNDT